ncbi:MAG: DNA polymerase III subunit delta' [Oscillatoria princeps RMCB-10]|jgi:DNA polymerase-3 subunit delta'|nr:DNA polymerase III subunit delta' [Oscillatoria princeps RMCB-10]
MNFFAELIGQERAVELLTQAVALNRIAPAYLFAGADGVGRSLAARCFIEQVFCAGAPTPQAGKGKGTIESVQNRVRQGNHPDVLWVAPTYLHQGKRLSAKEAAAAGVKRRAPPQIRLEQVREIGQFLSLPPLQAPRKVVAVERAETMAEAAANGLLKTLEEPGNATLILIAPSAESLLPTLVSRCQRIPFYRLTPEAMAQVLRRAGCQEIVGNEPVMAIAQGSPGEAIAAMQQLQAIPQELLQKVRQMPRSIRQALELAREIDKTLDTEAQLWLVEYLQHCYWQQQQKAGAIDKLPIEQLERARQYLLSYAQPRLVWECALMAMCQG